MISAGGEEWLGSERWCGKGLGYEDGLLAVTILNLSV